MINPDRLQTGIPSLTQDLCDYVKIGKHWRVRREELVDFLKSDEEFIGASHPDRPERSLPGPVTGDLYGMVEEYGREPLPGRWVNNLR